MTMSTADEVMQQKERKMIWVADKEKAFILAQIKDEMEDSYVVVLEDGSEKRFRKIDTQKVNPQKFDAIEDLAGLSYLNEASVLHNLCKRYLSGNIYTYSGLFLVALNPFRNLGIYSDKLINRYSMGKKCELRPHIFAVANDAYTSMLMNNKNQSILITGESGAGKTENTKKVISFLAYVAQGYTSDGDVSIEQKIIDTNPILEAFGNAQTTRNYNSSRFGKFIKITFERGRITGASIEKYLLERSRVTDPSPNERNYHIFYQLLKGGSKDLLAQLLLTGKQDDYKILRGTPHSVPGIDDAKEFNTTITCMRRLGFSEDTVQSVFKIVAAILHLGNVSFRENDEKGEICDISPAETACNLLSIPLTGFIKNILNPISVMSHETVTRNRSKDQARRIVDSLCRLLYEKLFDEIIKTINKCIKSPMDTSYIGVLDIAGFEIFRKNNFEQFCINYTNEKLQQFFNHHMFILEQEIYKKEQIEWNYIDFGLDLSPTINLIESCNPIGIFAYIDEECVMPKANEETLLLKLQMNLKAPEFEMCRFSNGFKLKHYAGITEYEVDGWLSKNKEPYFENVFELIVRSDDEFVRKLVPKISKGERKGFFRTVAQKHKEQLSYLMQQLRTTSPHFVRCILPNCKRSTTDFDNNFILHQLRCNGVLEGIRISRLGYPNRMSFREFIDRYHVIYKKYDGSDEKTYIGNMCEALLIPKNLYKLGITKIFFKQGVLAEIEEVRETRLMELSAEVCALIRAFMSVKRTNMDERKRKSADMLKKEMLLHLRLRKYSWWRLYQIVKPLLDVTKKDEHEKEQLKKIKEFEQKVHENIQEITKLNNAAKIIMAERSELASLLEKEKLLVNEKNELISAMRNEKLSISEELAQKDLANRNLQNKLSDAAKNCAEHTMLIETITSENEKLKCKMASLSSEHDALVKNYDELRVEKQSMRNKIDIIEAEMQAMSVKNKSQLESLVFEKEKELIHLTNLMQQTNEEKQKIHEQTLAYQKQIDELKNLRDQEKNKMEELSMQNQSLGIENAKTASELEKTRNEFKAQSKRLCALAEDFSVSNKSLSRLKTENEDILLQCQKFEDEAQRLSSELRKKTLEIQHLNNSLELEKENSKNLELSIKHLEDENKALAEIGSRASNFSKMDEFKALEDKISRLEKKNAELNECIASERMLDKTLKIEQINAQKKTFSEMQSKYERVLKELAKTNSEKKALSFKITRLENENKDLRASLEEQIQNEESTGSNDFNMSVLESEKKIRDDLRSELSQQENINMQLRSDLEALQESFNAEIKERDALINDLKNKAINKMGTVDFKNMRREVDMLKKTIKDTLCAYQQSFKTRTDDYKKEIVVLENKLKKLQMDNYNLNKEKEEMKLCVDAGLSNNAELNSSLTFYKQNNDELLKKLKDREIDLIKNRNAIAELEATLSGSTHRYEYMLKLSDEKNRNLVKMLADRDEQIVDLNAQLHKFGEELGRLSEMIKESDTENALKKENNKLMKEYERLQIETQEIKNECSKLRELLDKYEKNLFDIESKFNAVKKENELTMSLMACKEREIDNWKRQYMSISKELQEITTTQIPPPELSKIEVNAVAMDKNVQDNSLEFENSRLSTLLQKKQETINQLKDEKRMLSEESLKMRKKIEALELSHKQLEREFVDEKNTNKLLRIIKSVQKGRS